MVYIGFTDLLPFSVFGKFFSRNLKIPTDRLLHEIAFKLWKTPKYGAQEEFYLSLFT